MRHSPGWPARTLIPKPRFTTSGTWTLNTSYPVRFWLAQLTWEPRVLTFRCCATLIRYPLLNPASIPHWRPIAIRSARLLMVYADFRPSRLFKIAGIPPIMLFSWRRKSGPATVFISWVRLLSAKPSTTSLKSAAILRGRKIAITSGLKKDLQTSTTANVGWIALTTNCPWERDGHFWIKAECLMRFSVDGTWEELSHFDPGSRSHHKSTLTQVIRALPGCSAPIGLAMDILLTRVPACGSTSMTFPLLTVWTDASEMRGRTFWKGRERRPQTYRSARSSR